MKNEIIIYQQGELAEHIEVRLDEENETVWLNQYQLAELFQTDRTSIIKHLQNIYSSGELEENATCAKIAQVRKEGNRKVTREVLHYNLDAILSVGYKVNSKQGTQFRIWANRILKEHLLKGYTINNRMNRLEDNLEDLKNKVNQIDLQINTQLVPTQGIFFDGQIPVCRGRFDAYTFFSSIIKRAKKEIILIDNYIDESTLTHLSKKEKQVKVILYTKFISPQLNLDVKKANEQYGGFKIHSFSKSHDRFLIIDGVIVYHIGSSLKDLGKKCLPDGQSGFAFTKMEKESVDSLLKAIGR
jgi:hypothetical protein